MKASRFPPGWNESRVRRVIRHYEDQNENEAVAEDEAASVIPSSSTAHTPTAPARSSPAIRRPRRSRSAHRLKC